MKYCTPMLIASLALPSLAAAAPEVHDGFLFRLTNGPTRIESTAEPGREAALSINGDLAIDGSAGTFELMLGYAVREGLIFHLAVVEVFDSEATYQVNGQGLDYADRDLQMSAVGVGATWYSRTNFYLSATVLGASLQVNDTLCEESFDACVPIVDLQGGGLIRLALGKEWWVSDNWGLGVGVSLMGGQFMEGSDVDGRALTGELSAGSIFLSATYN